MHTSSEKPHDPGNYWDKVYASNRHDRLSWYQERPQASLDMIEATGIGPDSPIIDVGGGASLLGDFLLQSGYTDITVLDCSREALDCAKRRLGSLERKISWIIEDIRHFRSSERFALWHDRAVFHFFVDHADRRRYLDTLDSCLDERGHVVLATFAPSGPKRCSCQDVVRYDETVIAEWFEPKFRLISTLLVCHETPSCTAEDYMYFYFRRRDSFY
ncbi:MAG: class I SAM-dependent methyltransferase [Chlorobi bacterium]|nr:class I SAM-dependent methyltransferase [Chlorobiota bacterium]